MKKEIRWKQRFAHFDNAYKTFSRVHKAYEKNRQDEIHKIALVQCFEFSLELSWKTMKDYLEASGYEVLQTPKEVVRLAFQAGLLTQAEDWMAALEKRNYTSHTYNLEILNNTVQFIDTVFCRVLNSLYFYLKEKL